MRARSQIDEGIGTKCMGVRWGYQPVDATTLIIMAGHRAPHGWPRWGGSRILATEAGVLSATSLPSYALVVGTTRTPTPGASRSPAASRHLEPTPSWARDR